MVARLAGGGSEAPLGPWREQRRGAMRPPLQEERRASAVSSEAGTEPSPRVKWSFHVLSNTVSLTDGLEWQKGKPSLAQ